MCSSRKYPPGISILHKNYNRYYSNYIFYFQRSTEINWTQEHTVFVQQVTLLASYCAMNLRALSNITRLTFRVGIIGEPIAAFNPENLTPIGDDQEQSQAEMSIADDSSKDVIPR